MKVIFSRKGFDSAHGGYPSPILPNGLLVSLPIPEVEDKIKYSELRLDGKTYFEIMKELKPKILYDGKWHELDKETKCHLDPDIYEKIIDREGEWRAAFGQVGAAQAHLGKENQNINVGDIFLFFGWFKRTEHKEGKLKFVRGAPDLHVIFGYLQIGKICPLDGTCPIELPVFKRHPHLKYTKVQYPNNTLYAAQEENGAGVFAFHKDLILTKEGFPRSRWDLPAFFREAEISYHTKAGWKGGYFQSAAIGQEFVVSENKEVEKWAKNILDKHAPKNQKNP